MIHGLISVLYNEYTSFIMNRLHLSECLILVTKKIVILSMRDGGERGREGERESVLQTVFCIVFPLHE